jgi:hypothetical protein
LEQEASMFVRHGFWLRPKRILFVLVWTRATRR